MRRRKCLTVLLAGLTLALLSGSPVLADSAIEAGRAAFARDGCDGCHGVTRSTSPMTIAERAALKGPNLWYVGSKLKRDWLETWLPAPTPIMGVRYDSLPPDTDITPHPAAPEADGVAIAAYLMSLTDSAMQTGVIDADTPPSHMERLQGRVLYGKEQQCFACHLTRTRYGAEVGGVTAPTLTDAGRRLNPDWIYAFLMDQTRYTPVTRMPIYAGDTYTEYTPERMRVLAGYIARMGR
ncbi:MAG: c-type cytochrome [Leptospirillia bacterium]